MVNLPDGNAAYLNYHFLFLFHNIGNSTILGIMNPHWISIMTFCRNPLHFTITKLPWELHEVYAELDTSIISMLHAPTATNSLNSSIYTTDCGLIIIYLLLPLQLMVKWFAINLIIILLIIILLIIIPIIVNLTFLALPLILSKQLNNIVDLLYTTLLMVDTFSLNLLFLNTPYVPCVSTNTQTPGMTLTIAPPSILYILLTRI